MNDVDTLASTPSPPSLEWTTQQKAAIDKVADWYHRGDEQVFRLFGYAGTGKTTLAHSMVDDLGLTGQALYAAYTGKAAYVLRTKGCGGASTIHSLIYAVKDKARAKLNELHLQLAGETDLMQRDILTRAIAIEEAKLANPDWILREDSELGAAPLLVLDEVSMVSHQIAADLLSFGAKLLVLGDPAQLPPVEGGGYFINAAPDHLLDEIHRSALDSPVTRLATAVRAAPPGDRALGVSGPDGDSGRFSRLSGPAELLSFDQVIVGKNATRWQFNEMLRALRGLTGPIPQPSDRVIVLANNSANEVFNGQQLSIEQANVNPDFGDVIRLTAVDDEGHGRTLDVWASGFTDIAGEKLAKRNGRGRIAAATWGHAITCHKSQGSQWDRVLVIDESHVFARGAYRDHIETHGPTRAEAEAHLAGKRWLYTAITRAAQRVAILGGRGR